MAQIHSKLSVCIFVTFENRFYDGVSIGGWTVSGSCYLYFQSVEIGCLLYINDVRNALRYCYYTRIWFIIITTAFKDILTMKKYNIVIFCVGIL